MTYRSKARNGRLLRGNAIRQELRNSKELPRQIDSKLKANLSAM